MMPLKATFIFPSLNKCSLDHFSDLFLHWKDLKLAESQLWLEEVNGAERVLG